MTKYIIEMNYKVTFLGLIMFLSAVLSAQMTFSDSIKARYDSLEPYITTGLLADRSPLSPFLSSSVSNPLRLNGIGDTAADKRIWSSLQRNLYHMAYNPADMNFHPAVFDSLLEVERYGQSRTGMTVAQFMNLVPRNDLVLGFIDRKFNMITPEAFDSAYIKTDTLTFNYTLNAGYIQLNDTVFADTISYSTHPDSILVLDTNYYRDPDSILPRTFSTHRSLAIGALHNQAYGTGTNPTIDIAIPQVFQMTLPGKTYEIDYGDGRGYQPWPTGQLVQISYPSYGEKTITLRTPYTGPGSDTLPYLLAKTNITVSELKQGEPDERIQLPNQFVNACPLSYDDFGIGKGVGFVKYRKNAGANPKLKKPVIIVEGLETGNTRTPILDNGDYHGFGDLNWRSFSSGNFGTVAPQLSKFPDFMDSLRTAGYDVIVLDLLTNRTVIQQNGNLLINLIQYVNNQLLTYQSDEEIVLIGASMGGLVARWGARKMEMEGCCHNIRLYGSFSAPHQGANIPIGLQEFLYSLAYPQNMLGKGDGAKKLYDHALNSPVARQMLVYHRESSAASERAAFVEHLDSMGFPEDCRLVGLTNGSGTGRIQQANNEAMTGRFLAGGDALVTVDQKVWAPVSVPASALGLGVLTLQSAFNITSGNTWTMVNAEAYAVSASSSPSNQLILKRGDNAQTNLNRLYLQFGIYVMGTVVAFIINLVHGILYAIAITMFCALCPPVALSNIKALTIAYGTFTALLATHYAVHEDINNNNSQHYRYINNYPTLSYDNAPGDYNTTQFRIHQESLGAVDYHGFKHHSFIATVSALGIDTNDLFLNVRVNEEALIQSGKTPFELIYLNSRGSEDESVNERHVEITDNNLSWLMEVIRATDNPLQVQPLGQTWQLDKYYNYGEPDPNLPPSRFLEDTWITAGGVLHVNHFGNVGYATSSYGNTVQGSFFRVLSGNPNCEGAHVVIDNQGEMIVGDSGPNPNRGEAIFQRNGTLEIMDGGSLTIHQNSRLLIEPGAELIIHPGAIIDLQGQNAVLELQGKLTLQQNAIFQPIGSGFVRFNQNPQGGNWSNFLSFATGSQMHFTATGKFDKRVEILTDTHIETDLDSIVFNACKVEMAPGVSFNVHASMSAVNAYFTSQNGNDAADGLRLFGQDQVYVNNSRFSHCSRGLEANLLTYGHPVTVRNSEFDHNTEGLVIIGKNFTALSGNFNHNDIGLKAENIDGVSKITNGDFLNNTDQGIKVVGQNGSELKISGSTVENSQYGGLIEGTTLQSWCSSYKNNDVGLQVEEGQLIMGKPQGHNNNFSGNRMDVNFYELNRLKLVSGFNGFSGWYRYMVGTFSGNATSFLYLNPTTGNYELDVKDNNMPLTGGTTVPVDIALNQQPVGLRNWGPPSVSTNPCQSASSPSSPGLSNCCFKTGITVNLLNHGDIPLDSAILVSVSEIDNGELSTLDNLRSIMQDMAEGYCYPGEEACEGEEIDEVGVLVLRDAYHYYLTALSNAYRNGLIPLNRANSEGEVSEYLSFIVNESNRRLNAEVPTADEPEELEFYYNLSKSHAYRTGEHYQEALSLLENGNLWQTQRQLDQAQYWTCVCHAEEALILEEIEPDNFAYQLELCRENIQSKKSRYVPDFGGVQVSTDEMRKQTQRAELAPNPSRGNTAIIFAIPVSTGTYAVYSVEGRRVASGIIPAKITEVSLEHSLPPGYYTVQIDNQSGYSTTLKWIVQ